MAKMTISEGNEIRSALGIIGMIPAQDALSGSVLGCYQHLRRIQSLNTGFAGTAIPRLSLQRFNFIGCLFKSGFY
jgi:hypothetical protein